jgi:hypothetical protein
MPSHKVLKSISHNFCHSFISLMNYQKDDYFLGHLLKQMRNSRLNKLKVDVIKNISKPKKLLNETIVESIDIWNKWFPDLVKRSGSSMVYIKSANLIIEFDLKQTRQCPFNNKYIENPFVCEFKIIDDRGIEFKSRQEGWWFPET